MDQETERASQPRSRRQMLFGGLAAAAGVALGRFAQPEAAAAATGDPVVQGALNQTDDSTSLIKATSVAGSFAFDAAGAGASNGLRGQSGSGIGLRGYSTSGTGVVGESDGATSAGVIGRLGPDQNVGSIEAGVFGQGTNQSSTEAGVWGDSAGTGVVGSGALGVYGTGSIGVLGDVAPGATGLYGFVGSAAAPAPAPNVAVEARAPSTAHLALNVVGKAKFSRSGRATVAAGRSYVTVSLVGVTTSSLILATMYTYRSGTSVISATPTTGSFTIRLNKAVTLNSYVSWMVLN